jgi:hypothetical protein
MGQMDRDGLTVVPEASAPLVLARAAEPAADQADEQASGQAGQPPARQRRAGTFRALHSKPFRLYFIGQVASASGTFLQQTAMGWLVLRLTGNAASPPPAWSPGAPPPWCAPRPTWTPR